MTKILLIGKPHSGKTTFIGQLCARAEIGINALKLYKPVADLTPIIEARRSLAKGEEVRTTPTDKNLVITLPLIHGSNRIDLDCPDYGGEQVNSIVENRELDQKWIESVKESENWILFIKPSDLTTFYDLSNKTVKPEVLENSSGEAEEYSISDQTFFIELLQILLYAKEQDAHYRNTSTKLTIVLTCWDELDDPKNPAEEFSKVLPLLANFITNNWREDKVNILGLSAQGGSLKNQELKNKYLDEGSEKFGYLLKSDGSKTNDITELILEAV